jgi:hypothetical protein
MANQGDSQFNYVDGIGAIAVADGVVRFDLIAITSFEEGKGISTRAGGLAMSLPAMIKMHNQFGQLINELVQKGVLQKNKEPATSPAAAKEEGGRKK